MAKKIGFESTNDWKNEKEKKSYAKKLECKSLITKADLGMKQAKILLNSRLKKKKNALTRILGVTIQSTSNWAYQINY